YYIAWGFCVVGASSTRDARRSHDRTSLRLRIHVTAATLIRRIAIAVPKGTRQRGVGRRAAWLPGDGRRRKDEAGDEPQGCASCRALGAGESRTYQGSRPLRWLGMFCRDL